MLTLIRNFAVKEKFFLLKQKLLKTVMKDIYLICFILVQLIFRKECATCYDDGHGPTMCTSCTNGLCDCPNCSRHGWPCVTSLDVSFKKNYFTGRKTS